MVAGGIDDVGAGLGAGDAESTGRGMREDGDFCAGIDDPGEAVAIPGALENEVGKASGAGEGKGIVAESALDAERKNALGGIVGGGWAREPELTGGDVDEGAEAAEGIEAHLSIVAAGGGMVAGGGGEHEGEGRGADLAGGEHAHADLGGDGAAEGTSADDFEFLAGFDTGAEGDIEIEVSAVGAGVDEEADRGGVDVEATRVALVAGGAIEF